MKFNRRSFMGFLGLQYATIKSKFNAANSASSWTLFGESGETDPSTWPAQQGPTDATSAQIVWSIPKDINVQFSLTTPAGNETLKPVGIYKEATSDWAQYHFLIDNLTPGQDYKIEVFQGSQKKDSRLFQSLRETGRDFNFAIISCMNDFFYKKEVWDELEKARPEAIFMIGDSTYADFVKSLTLKPANRQQMWRRYMETRLKLKFYHMPRLIPVFAVWDDHDFGSNNADRNFKYKKDAYEVWPSFFPRTENRVFKVGPGMSSVVEIRNHRLFLFDNRSFRSSPGEANPAYFGQDQKNWALDILSKSRKATYFLSGTQWFGGYRKKEGFEFAQPDLMKAFLTEVRKTKNYIIFGSGDIHMSEIMNVESDWLGYPTYEITSSAMHSLSGPGWSDRLDNPRRLHHVVASNFKILKSQAGSQFICDVRCIKSNGAIAYETTLGVVNRDRNGNPIDPEPSL